LQDGTARVVFPEGSPNTGIGPTPRPIME
jgi:hypothetical protein